MRFKDLKTGNTLSTDNEFTLAQFKKYPKRYKPLGAAGAKPDTDPMASWSAKELTVYAQDKNIDIGNATSASGILKKIREVEPLGAAGE